MASIVGCRLSEVELCLNLNRRVLLAVEWPQVTQLQNQLSGLDAQKAVIEKKLAESKARMDALKQQAAALKRGGK